RNTRFLPWTMRVVGSGLSISVPSARIAAMVHRQSSLGRKPRSTQGPLLMAASITARCEMLLSPGTVISARIVGARRIFQSDIFFRRTQAVAQGLGFGEEVVHRCFAVEECDDFAQLFNHRLSPRAD